ncbi:DUF2213 domain-containing protein [Salmonella enterica subsp. enterica]|nr:DUF2213 domain-containing protein [Salmonella enterica subsp. enterica]EDR3673592.1 DUF2213 domain-containing protein [Salmonella enterica subsp. arizonae serovar 40:z4,z24:]
MEGFFAIDAAFSQRKKTPQGFLSVPCRIARSGVQQYQRCELGLDGEPWALVDVYRPPEEVFAPEAIASFDGVPITNEHPPELVTADNWKQYAVGMVTNPRREGDYLVADLLFTARDAIDDIEQKKREELSGGYVYDYRTNYIATDGKTHGAAQTKIRGNHVALTKKGRAGYPVRVTDSKPTGNKTMRKIAIDGIPFEMEEQAAAAVEKLMKQVGDSASTLETVTGELDVLKKENAELRKKASDSAISERVKALAAESVDREKLITMAKDAANSVVIKAVVGDSAIPDADITAVRTALRVLEAGGRVSTDARHQQETVVGKNLLAGDAVPNTTSSARDSYINGFNRSEK